MSAAAFLRVKKLTGAGIIKVAAMHNRRAIVAELGADGHIDASRCALNVIMEGPDTPQAVAELAQGLMDAAGVGKLRKDAVRAVEAVFSLPPDGGGVDHAAYFARCIEWARTAFGPVLSADAHHDEAAPHLHVLCLPLVDGRMQGSDLVGGPAKLRALQAGFHADVAQGFGLKRAPAKLSGSTREGAAAAVLAHLRAIGDPVLKSAMWPAIRDAIERDPRPFAEYIGFDVPSASAAPKPAKSFTSIMTSRGKGARTHAEADRRDRALMARKPIGFEAVGEVLEVVETGPVQTPAKTRSLCSVGVAHPKGSPTHVRPPAMGHAEGGTA
jgi:Plasmid recombination enzyme